VHLDHLVMNHGGRLDVCHQVEATPELKVEIDGWGLGHSTLLNTTKLNGFDALWIVPSPLFICIPIICINDDI
jgi:hypothetical protein